MEYLGHVITPEGLKPNKKLVQAVQEFPSPKDISGVRQYLGMCYDYRRFIPHYASIAKLLHLLTCKGAAFVWLTNVKMHSKPSRPNSPTLDNLDMTKPFVLEIDTSDSGLGAVLSQSQDDGALHPVAYSNRSLTRP